MGFLLSGVFVSTSADRRKRIERIMALHLVSSVQFAHASLLVTTDPVRR